MDTVIKYLDLQRITGRHASEIGEAIRKVVDSGRYLQGEQTEAFEEDYARYIGVRHCVTCGNGFDALALILRAYMELGEMRPGDEIIVPGNTYIATILAITESGLTPVLVEPRSDTFQIDDGLIEERITGRTRAVMLVHLYGRCGYTEKIKNICRKHRLRLLEDNAQAAGCVYQVCANADPHIKKHASSGLRTGALGDAAAHSFYPGKNLGALGDAGAITTCDGKLASVIRSLGNYGSGKKYVFERKGRNSRMDELQACVLRVKLRYLDEENKRRKDIGERYIREVKNIRIVMPGGWYADNNVFHIFPVLCRDRDMLQQYLQYQGIQTLIHYPIAPHRQQCYKEWNAMSLPVTERIHREEISVPLHQALTDEEVGRIISALNSF